MIHAYTGEGKGKTTCAIGLLVRAFGAGKKVIVIFFDKGSETYRHNELVSLDRLGIEYHVTGLERMEPDGKFRFGVTEGDKREALRGIAVAENAIKIDKFDMVVLDEALPRHIRLGEMGLLRHRGLEIHGLADGPDRDQRLPDALRRVRRTALRRVPLRHAYAHRPQTSAGTLPRGRGCRGCRKSVRAIRRDSIHRMK